MHQSVLSSTKEIQTQFCAVMLYLLPGCETYPLKLSHVGGVDGQANESQVPDLGGIFPSLIVLDK